MRKKLTIAAVTLAACAGLIALVILHCAEDRQVESDWRWFAENIRQGEFDRAYQRMTQQYRNTHALNQFMTSPWCETNHVVSGSVRHSGVHLVYVTRWSPFSRRARVVLTTSNMALPLCLEDGFVAVVTRMEKEGERWRVADVWQTVMR
jgi:hypothetical protein